MGLLFCFTAVNCGDIMILYNNRDI